MKLQNLEASPLKSSRNQKIGDGSGGNVVWEPHQHGLLREQISSSIGRRCEAESRRRVSSSDRAMEPE